MDWLTHGNGRTDCTLIVATKGQRVTAECWAVMHFAALLMYGKNIENTIETVVNGGGQVGATLLAAAVIALPIAVCSNILCDVALRNVEAPSHFDMFL